MAVSRDILKGFVDMHVHAGPSIAVRKVDAAEMLEKAEAAGYRAFLVKDELFPDNDGNKDGYGTYGERRMPCIWRYCTESVCRPF